MVPRAAGSLFKKKSLFFPQRTDHTRAMPARLLTLLCQLAAAAGAHPPHRSEQAAAPASPAFVPASGQPQPLARAPPLGFNTWNHFACGGINSEVMMKTADVMVSTGLAAAGFEYINSDDCWMLAGTNRSDGGRGPQVPNPGKFPDGIEKTIEYIHKAGLKFGLYTALANKTCAGYAAACMHEKVDAAQYARWKVDYLKDDSCGQCRAYDALDYAAMASALEATGRPIILTVEGSPPVALMSKGGHGQAKRVGHDIRPFWYSVVSEVDTSSGLWSFAHNASGASGAGYWNDMDIIEIGNGNVFNPQNFSDAAQLHAARAHFTMWCALKSVMLLGNDLSIMSPAVLSVLSNKEAISVSQDALGVQARRVVSMTPPGSNEYDIAEDNLANVAPCAEDNPLQRWWYRDAHSSNSPRMLRIVDCNSSDPYQQWKHFTGVGVLENVGMSLGADKMVLDANFGPAGIEYEWRSPIGFGRESTAKNPSQLWSAMPELSNRSRFKLRDGHYKGCLNVYGNTGPDVSLGKGCKSDTADANEVFAWEGNLLRTFVEATPKCLAATAGPAGGYIFTKDSNGKEWCLVGDGYQDHSTTRSVSFSAVPCTEAEADAKFPLQGVTNGSAPHSVTIGDGTNNIGCNGAKFGSSGPLPRSSYLTANMWGTHSWIWDLSGGAMKPPVQSEFNDNSNVEANVSAVPKISGSKMCVTLQRGGNLEVWTGPLSGGRAVVVLFNRYYKPSAITAEWSMLGLSTQQKMHLRDVWSAKDAGLHSGSYTEPAVPAHGVTLLVLTPVQAPLKSDDTSGNSDDQLPWAPPPLGSAGVVPSLRNTSRPKLAYSTYIGWYEDGGLNESTLDLQVQAMATRLRPFGWDTIQHDYGWQVCGSTYHVHDLPNGSAGSGCIHVDQYGRLFPSPLRFPSTSVNDSYGSWKPFIDKAHQRGIGFGLHLMQGIPKEAVAKKLPILGTNFTADQIIVRQRACQSFVPDHWAIDAAHPGAAKYYDSIVSNWAEQGLDFIYFDGILDCGYCHIGVVSLLSDSLRRLGNGMYMFTSWGPPNAAAGCSFEALSALAPYVRVGADTIDSFGGSIYNGFSEYTQAVAPAVRPHHFGDLASLMVGKVHCVIINGGHVHNNASMCPPGPDYYIPSNRSSLTKDEVISYTSLIAIFRSTWWPSGVLSEMDEFELSLLTNEAVLRVAMMGQTPRQVVAAGTTGIVWTSDDSVYEGWKYVLLVNRGDSTLAVGVDLDQLGLVPVSSCNVTGLWDGKVLEPVYGRLEATLCPHASLFVRLSGCHDDPSPPPQPHPLPGPPSTQQTFCPQGNLSACEAALRVPGAAASTCSSDFEHVERAAMPKPDDGATVMLIDALHLDAVGNRHSDLHVVGVVYSDSDGPAKLVATSEPVLVLANASRSFVRLPFEPTLKIDLTQTAAIWMGEQAGAPPGSKPIPGGPNSLQCFAMMAQSSLREPLRYTPWPYADGPKPDFGPASNVTVAQTSLSIFASVRGPLPPPPQPQPTPPHPSPPPPPPPPPSNGHRVHPFPGGDTFESPRYSVLVGPVATAQPSFVWYTAVSNRQPIAPKNNIPQTAKSKDTSWVSFDMQAPTLVAVRMNNGTVGVNGFTPAMENRTVLTAAMLPSGSGIIAQISSDRLGVSFVVDRPRQVCLIVNGNMDAPLCIFADPPEEDAPQGPSENVIYFGPGVHHPFNSTIEVTENQSVYIAGGAHVYGQVRAKGVAWNGFWVGGSPCDNVRVHGRGVLDGHNIPINFAAHAMIELPNCANIVVEGITTVDSPQYQIDNLAPGAEIHWAKAIAWGFSTDGWSAGEYSLVSDSFNKVNDDSSKLYNTGSVVQRGVFWQMENGCPFMMSWNLNVNSGFMTARDNDVIAHEKKSGTNVDGVICALHGGSGFLDNWLFLDNRIESAYALISLNIAKNPWGSAKQPGSISSILIRNLTAVQSFASPDPFHVAGNKASDSRVDSLVYEGVRIAGQPLTSAQVQPGIGPLVTNVSVCERSCGDRILPAGAQDWTRDQICGRAPQPFIGSKQLPALSNPDVHPYCAGTR
jgi:hypothetical protein